MPSNFSSNWRYSWSFWRFFGRCLQVKFQSSYYLYQTVAYLEPIDIASGLIKASVFGLLLGIMGCFHGYNCSRGAQGVGLATTNAVVSGCILILIFNYLVTELFFSS